MREIPPLSLFPGDVGFSFNAEAFPADGTAGSQFAIPEPAGLTDQGHTVRWQTIFGTSPTAISIRLQGAMADVDAEYPRVATLGVEWVMPPTTQPWGNRSMVFRDPAGNLVNVFSRDRS